MAPGLVLKVKGPNRAPGHLLMEKGKASNTPESVLKENGAPTGDYISTIHAPSVLGKAGAQAGLKLKLRAAHADNDAGCAREDSIE
ncbi:hypothetical protein N9L68_07885 [bacterium]|nr:hypothetical protein [bacterium]